MDNVEFTLPVTTPFRLDLTAWALRRRGGHNTDQWNGGRYSRVVVDRDRGVRVVVAQPGGAAQEVVVTLRSEGQIDDHLQGSARALVQKVFGLSADLTPFYRLAKGDVLLEDLAAEFAGVRPPRFPSTFEALVNSVACQQVSLESGIATLNRLAQTFGVPMVHDGAYQDLYRARGSARRQRAPRCGARHGWLFVTSAYFHLVTTSSYRADPVSTKSGSSQFRV